jgi:hypothetical protein
VRHLLWEDGGEDGGKDSADDCRELAGDDSSYCLRLKVGVRVCFGVVGW